MIQSEELFATKKTNLHHHPPFLPRSGQCLYTYLELESKSTKAAIDTVHDLAVRRLREACETRQFVD